jgi:hypothetical protein
MKLAEAERRFVDLEARLTRSETSRLAALAERDAVRTTLSEHEMNTRRTYVVVASRRGFDLTVTRLENKLAQRDGHWWSPAPELGGQAVAYRDRR